MGTRSLTKIYNEENKILVTMYRQYDGYPSGHGVELLEFLNGFQIVNGLGVALKGKIANGMGCIAAQIIAHFKDGPGGVYIETPAATANACDAEYVYYVYDDYITIKAPTKTIFTGKWADAYEFCKSEN